MTATPTDPATLRLLAGRAHAVRLAPYLATALYAMKPIQERRIPTLGVDPQWRMYWNPDFVLTLPVNEVAGVWLHEVGHLLRTHRARFTAFGHSDRHHRTWNQAADAAINADLRDSNITLPPIKAVFPERIHGATRDMTAEQMYRLLLDAPDAPATSNVPDLALRPGLIAEGRVHGTPVVAAPREAVTGTLSVTIHNTEGNEVSTPAAQRWGARMVAFTLTDELPAGNYEVTLTDDDASYTGTLSVAPPSIELRPDYLPPNWTAPTQVTVYSPQADFSQTPHVALYDADGAEVAIDNQTRVSGEYLTFTIDTQVADGIYRVKVTDHGVTSTQMFPIGLPHIDLTPESLPVGHATPYPLAASADGFTFDDTTTVSLYAATPLGVVPITGIDLTRVRSENSADLAVTEALEEGNYLVVAETGDVTAVAVLTVSQGQGGGGESDSEGNSGESGSSEGGEPGQGDDCGSGATGGQRPWDRGDDTSDGSVDEGRGDLLRRQTAQDIRDHSRTRGDVPGGWGRWADEILNPKVDWRKQLRTIVSRTCANVAGARDYSYARPSRRASAMPNVVFPSMRAPRPPAVAVVVDTSGSVSDRMLAQAIADMRSLLRQVGSQGGQGLAVIACDAAAAEMKSVRSMNSLTSLEGGGGTDMRVGIKKAAELTPRVDLIVTFTDGYTPWPTEPPAANPGAKNVVVLLTEDASAAEDVPDWMHVVVAAPSRA